MPAINLQTTTHWITDAVLNHPTDLVPHLMQRLSASRASVRRLIERLEAGQWLRREGTPRKPVFHPGLLRQAVHTYPIDGLAEDAPWRQDFASNFALPASVLRMLQHAFCELVNNAIDHSGGDHVTVSMRQTPSHVQLLVSDDGCGLFERIREDFAIHDSQHAMLELSKGKLTSQPDRHMGRGLFFVARLADVFDVQANGSAFQRRDWESSSWRSHRPVPRLGTSVYVSVALDTQRTLEQVLAIGTRDAQGAGFDATIVPMRLLVTPECALDSRAQARRVASRLQAFRRVELDFGGVPEIGYAFADELFRVFARQQPDVDLVPAGMTPRVAALVEAARETV